MSDTFDPYLHWLGIRDPQRPPNHYALLGVILFEDDATVLTNAADRQMSHVRRFQAGKHSAISQQVLNELATAKICLLSAEKKEAYDAALRAELPAATAAPATEPAIPLPPIPDVIPAPTPPEPPPVVPLPEIVPPVLLRASVWPAPVSKRPASHGAPILAGVLTLIALALIGLIVAFSMGVDARLLLGLKLEGTPEKPESAAKVEPDPSKGKTPDGTQVIDPTPTPKSSGSNPGEKPAPGPEAGAPPKTDEPEKAPEEKPPVTPPVAPPAKVEPPPAPPAAPVKPAPVVIVRKPAPDAAAVKDAVRTIHELFQRDYDKAKNDKGKSGPARAGLANTLYQKAIETRDDAVARFALLGEARDQAIEAGDARMFRVAIETLAREYEVDPWSMMAAGVQKIAKRTRDLQAGHNLANEVIYMTQAACNSEQFEAADILSEAARDITRKVKDPAQLKRAVALMGLVDLRKRSFDECRKAEEILKQTPEDPTANLQCGKYYCLYRNDWYRGLASLRRSGDDAIRAAIEAETPPPADLTASVALGDRWWDIGDAENDKELSLIAHRRAGSWYQRSLAGLSGLKRTIVEKRLSDLRGR